MIVRAVLVLVIIFSLATFFVLPKTQYKNLLASTQPSPIVLAAKSEVYPRPRSSFQEASPMTARSAVVIDAKTGISLFEKNPHLKHLPASTTKMMTALAALEKCAPSEVVTVKRQEKEGAQMKLAAGDQVTVENLLYGLLVASGNDAAFALADNCAGSYDDFIGKMNDKAKELDMHQTHFVNPAGYDDDLQYSTATDLAKLARVLSANPLLAKIVKTKSTVVTDVTGLKTYYLENVNKLLGIVEGVDGVKTGETDGAGQILISKTTREDNSIIVSVLGSKDRFGESQNLIEWAFANYIWPQN